MFQFKQLERRSLKKKKNQGFNGIRTHDLRVAGALLYQLSYEATHWERGQFIEFISSRCIFIDPAFLSQGCALRKIEGVCVSPANDFYEKAKIF